MTSIEELRAEARRLAEAARNVADPLVRKELAERGAELAQRAEALANPTIDPWVLRANIERYQGLLTSRQLNSTQTRIVKDMITDAENLLAGAPPKVSSDP